MRNISSNKLKTSPKRSDAVTCISRAAAILNALSLNINKLNDIAGKVNLSGSTVHRLLQGLIESGLVIEDPLTRRYYLGHNLIRLTSDTLVSHRYLISCTATKMEKLLALSHETVSLDIRSGLERIKLQVLMSEEEVAYVSKPHKTADLWTGAMGKTLLAQFRDSEIDVLLQNFHLKPLTHRTITDREIFKKEIEKVRQQGFALSYSEGRLGIAAISVPVRHYVEPVAISLVGPEFRFAQHMLDYLEDLQKAAREIEQDLLKTRGQPQNYLSGNSLPACNPPED